MPWPKRSSIVKLSDVERRKCRPCDRRGLCCRAGSRSFALWRSPQSTGPDGGTRTHRPMVRSDTRAGWGASPDRTSGRDRSAGGSSSLSTSSPKLYLLAGPNGSGKTTFANGDPDLRGLEFVNTDQKAAEFPKAYPGRRYARSLDNLPLALKLAARARVFDNSSTGRAELLAVYDRGVSVWGAEQLPYWAVSVLRRPLSGQKP